MDQGSNRYSEQDCLEALHAAAKVLGVTPTRSEYRTTGLSPSSEIISDRCGSWDAAVAKAGLEPKSREQYTDEQCLRALQNFAETYGEEPTIDSYKKSGYKPAAGTITKRLGSWSKAKADAGVIDDDEDLSVEEQADRTFEMLENAETGRKSN